jgi:hypothetical protein
MSVGSVFGLWPGGASRFGSRLRPSLCNLFRRSEIERPLHAEGPTKRSAAFRLVEAPEVGVQVRPSSR